MEPVIIPGENAGGNRTCDEVAAYFGSPGFDFTTGKFDYNGGFSGAFPEGFTIETDGTNVSWSFIPPPGFCLKSIAFIVKGSIGANVYNYGPGIYEDYGFTSPENASGDAACLRNLRVCYTLRECVVEEEKCYQEETAWASGSRYVARGNWATYASFPWLQRQPYEFRNNIIVAKLF
ncbi:hypothetical protein [Algoriphagus resistens]|uniref:hypothetical protein n=1 Tax=Algoriphagus resistens TaxID=1750590 RepID=UPI000716C09B|nr:hypothetical protein [Algoriphagus resistens]